MKCTHIALEFHENWCGMSYNTFINNFKILLGNTHKGFRTYYEKRRDVKYIKQKKKKKCKFDYKDNEKWS